MVKKSDRILCILFTLIVLYLTASVAVHIDYSFLNKAMSWLSTFNKVFISILMQAIPFILIGIFVSSILQVMIPGDSLVKIFPRNTVLGFIVAILSGILFPLCDCAVVPVAARLIKKGVPIPTVITFMLSAPLVNPIVIASTLYAFPGQPAIAFYRVYFGLTIALTVGIAFLFFPDKKTIVKSDFINHTCNCEHCSTHVDCRHEYSFLNKISMVFKHAGEEFFEVGKFLIIGAFLSSIFQTVLPKGNVNNLNGHDALALFIMMAAAFAFSICSTSDAFIAKTFINQFPLRSVMGFMVLGPMIDIKNMLMLLSSFRKGFVIKLIALIFIISFVMLYLQTRLLM